MANLELKAKITAEDHASSTISKVGGALTNFAKVGVAGAIAGVAALTYGLKKSVDSFMESEKVMAQTNATLKSTGGIAGVTSEQITTLAKNFQKVTMFSDEAIQSGENLLLTFTSIGKDIFTQATETMLNMSQALGQDVKSSAIQLGKALQDPILGVTALRRVGVNFNEEAQNTIKNLVETNRIAEAQTFILKELQTEFGGSAVAAGETFAGKVAILNNQMDDLKENIGQTIVIAITPFIEKLSAWASDPAVQAKIQQIVEALINWLIPAITNTAHWFMRNWDNIKAFGNALAMIANIIWTIVKAPFDWVYNQVYAISYAFFSAQMAVERFISTIVNKFGSIKSSIKDSLNSVTGSLNKLISGYNKIPGTKDIELIPSFQTGGIMPHTGLAYLHKGEQIIPSSGATNNNSATINIYGNINNDRGLSPEEIGNTINRQLELTRLGAF